MKTVPSALARINRLLDGEPINTSAARDAIVDALDAYDRRFTESLEANKRLREAEAIIGELQKLVVNVSGWVSRGRSETAIAAMDAAMHDGWAAMGWRRYIDRQGGSPNG